MQKFLGIALLVGGTIVGLILLWITNILINEEGLASTFAIIMMLIGFILFVLPQWVIGIIILKAEPNHRNEP